MRLHKGLTHGLSLDYAVRVRRVVAILLLLCFGVLGTGMVEYLHNQQHAREDALVTTTARNAGLPDLPHGTHDESNCEFHAQLHVPIMAAAWIPLLILLGLFVAFLTQLIPTPPTRQVSRCLVCRGPPLR